jgi:hypothetical protein
MMICAELINQLFEKPQAVGLPESASDRLYATPANTIRRFVCVGPEATDLIDLEKATFL